MTQELENQENYSIGEFEEMDLTEIMDLTFLVAINTGPRDKPSFISESVCGPLNFYEMAETVGLVYEAEQLHAKVIVPSKTFGEKPQVLDEKTVDFIEARHLDIVADGFLGGAIMEHKEYTCKAGFVEWDPEISESEDE